MSERRKQLNLRTDDELEAAIGELQRTDPGPRIPSAAQVVRIAVLQARDRRRARLDKAERRK